MTETSKAQIPPSASSFLINLTGALFYLISVAISIHIYGNTNAFTLSIIGIISAIIPIIFGEIFILKVHKRDRVGLHPKKPPNKERVRIKLFGFYAAIALLILLYSVVPEYKDAFYEGSFFWMLALLIPAMVIGWLYIEEFDARLDNPKDGLWHFGSVLLGRWDDADRKIVFSFFKSILLRAFFLPAMISYFMINTSLMVDGIDSFVIDYTSSMEFTASPLLSTILMIYFFLAAIDVLFATIGYLITFRVLDTDIRSTEPTIIGWIVCILCYYPFWEIIAISLFFSDLYEGRVWYEWLEGYTTLLAIWGPLVVLSMCLESFTTLTFGFRFSNLTYRGLISTGPFRYTKHPQYIAKMFNRFFFLMPFLSMDGTSGALKTTALFFAVCLIYYLRAKTEENHLSRYPEYVEYAHWIDQHGIFRWVGQLIPRLKFSEERAQARKLF